MKYKFLEEEFAYTGQELRSLFLYEKGLKGSAVVAWQGPCEVKTEQLVDFEDRVAKDFIKAQKMLHFIVEVFHRDIFYGIFIQRFLAETLKNILISKGHSFRREGDDVYSQEGAKINVSIATVASHSSLVHFAINVDATGAPVKAVGLKDLSVDPKELAEELSSALIDELEGIEAAAVKVCGV